MAGTNNNETRNFKSKRAATMAVSKANKAYEAACVTHCDENGRPIFVPEAVAAAAWAHRTAVIENARRQGLYGFRG